MSMPRLDDGWARAFPSRRALAQWRPFTDCLFNISAFFALRRAAGELMAILIDMECCGLRLLKGANAVGLRAKSLQSSKRDRRQAQGLDDVTNAFIGKPKEPCSFTGKKPAPLNSGP